MYASQYDDGLYESDSLDRGIGDTELDRVFENNDFSYIMDLDDIH
jgi:hypothetical protein